MTSTHAATQCARRQRRPSARRLVARADADLDGRDASRHPRRSGQLTADRSSRRTTFATPPTESGYQRRRAGRPRRAPHDGLRQARSASSDVDGPDVSRGYLRFRPTRRTSTRGSSHVLGCSRTLLREQIAVGKVDVDDRRLRRRASFGDFALPTSASSEQRAIADYLDTETARIDALIAKKRRMIELLDERLRDGRSSCSDSVDRARRRVPLERSLTSPIDWTDRRSATIRSAVLDGGRSP